MGTSFQNQLDRLFEFERFTVHDKQVACRSIVFEAKS
jgi:hypothetical protein